MLKKVVNTSSPVKFVLIKDSASEKGVDLLKYITNMHADNQLELHNFVFCGNFHLKSILKANVKNHDFSSDIRGWFSKTPDFNEIIQEINNKFVVIIDSLSFFISHYGISKSYQLIRKLINKPNLIQIATVLHSDVIEYPQALSFFQHLSSLSIVREPTTVSDNIGKRASFIYKKPSGKIVSGREEYEVKDNKLITYPIKTLKAEDLIEKNIDSPILPHSLTTFRLFLDEKEKQSRDKVVLPFLPKEIKSEKEEQVIYKFDEVDDWDEEDPDDDLDI